MNKKTSIIVALSDTHSCHNWVDIPKGDILIHCGDAELDDYSRVISFKQWFKNQPHKHKIFVPGNHDFAMQEREFNYTLDFESNGINVLIDKAITINGINFYGSPWCPTFMNWAFMKDDSDLAEHWDKIPEETNVLITHGPAYGIGDCVVKKNKHLGSKTLAKKIMTLPELRYHLYGHIHTGLPINDNNKHFASYNCSILNEDYKMENKATVFEITA